MITVRSHDTSYPAFQVYNISIDTIIPLSGTANPPTNGAHQMPPSVHVAHQRSSTVTLTGIDFSSVETSAAHALCKRTVNIATCLLTDQRYFGLLQDFRAISVFFQGTPAGDPAVRALRKVRGRETNRQGSSVVLDRVFQLQQCYVIVLTVCVIIRMYYEPFDWNNLFVFVPVSQIVLT